MSKISSLLAASLLAIPGASLFADEKASGEVDFNKQVKPILESACVRCHNPEEDDGDLIMTNLAACLKGGDDGPALVPGKPDDSSIYWTTVEPADSDDIMPPKDPPLDKSQTDILKKWIEQGAKWPKEVELKETTRVYFAKHIQPIFEKNCVSCHNADKDKGDYRMHTKKDAFTTGESELPSIVPFDTFNSYLYELVALDR